MITKGIEIPFGVVPVPEIAGIPEGKVRVRLRNNLPVLVFVKNATGTISFIPKVIDGKWYYDPILQQGRNQIK